MDFSGFLGDYGDMSTGGGSSLWGSSDLGAPQSYIFGFGGTPIETNASRFGDATGAFYQAGDFRYDPTAESLTRTMSPAQSSDLSISRWDNPYYTNGTALASPSGSANLTYGGTTAQPSIAANPKSDSSTPTLTGILGDVASTAKSLLGVWGGVQGIQYQAAAQKNSAELQKAQLDLQKQLATGQISVAKAKADSEQAVALGQAKVAALNAGYQAQLAQSGGVVGYAAKSILPIAGLGLLAYFIFVKKGKA